VTFIGGGRGDEMAWGLPLVGTMFMPAQQKGHAKL